MKSFLHRIMGKNIHPTIQFHLGVIYIIIAIDVIFDCIIASTDYSKKLFAICSFSPLVIFIIGVAILTIKNALHRKKKGMEL